MSTSHQQPSAVALKPASAVGTSRQAVPVREREVQEQHSKDVIAASMFNQQMIEQKERELQQSIASNYSRIRDVERELRELQVQVKLTAEPKKHALELLRKKIEEQNTKVQAVRRRYDLAKQAFEQLQSELDREEQQKQVLCDELNQLVTTSVSTQLEAFEQLRTKLEALQGGTAGMGRASSAPGVTQCTAAAPGAVPSVAARSSIAAGLSTGAGAASEPSGPAAASDSCCGNGHAVAGAQHPDTSGRVTGSSHNPPQQQPQATRAAAEHAPPDAAAQMAAAAAAIAEAEAEAAARNRHVQLPARSRQPPAPAAAGRRLHAPAASQGSHVARDMEGRFAGFEA